MGKRFIAAASAGTIALSVAGNAAAAPPQAEEFDLECDNGEAYTVWANGNGDFTPGHIIGSPGVLVPLSFEFTFTPAGGGDPEMESLAKGNGNAMSGKELVTCTFGFSGPDGDLSATVVGFIPGDH